MRQIDVVNLVQYKPKWKERYRHESELIKKLIEEDGEEDILVEHIGSTAVEGMCAKDIIDIMIVVKKIEHGEFVAQQLEEKLEYVNLTSNGLFKNKFFLSKNNDDGKFHVHIVLSGSEEMKNLIIFRNSLREDKNLFYEYATLKNRLYEIFPYDRKMYRTVKSIFIEMKLNEDKNFIFQDSNKIYTKASLESYSDKEKLINNLQEFRYKYIRTRARLSSVSFDEWFLDKWIDGRSLFEIREEIENLIGVLEEVSPKHEINEAVMKVVDKALNSNEKDELLFAYLLLTKIMIVISNYSYGLIEDEEVLQEVISIGWVTINKILNLQ